MKTPTMLYRYPGPVNCDGTMCETVIVEESEVDAMLADGWHANFALAKQAHDEALEPATTTGGLKAVHKGRGVYELQDAEGNVVESGLSKDEAQAKAAG